MATPIGRVTHIASSTDFGDSAPMCVIEYLESLSMEEIEDPIEMLQAAQLAHIEVSEKSLFQIASVVRRYAHIACIKEGYRPNVCALSELETFIDRLSEQCSERTELLYELRLAKAALTLAKTECNPAIAHLLHARLTDNKEEFLEVADETIALLILPGLVPWYYLPLYFEISFVFYPLRMGRFFVALFTDKITEDWSSMYCVVQLLFKCVDKKKEQEKTLSQIESLAKRAYRGDEFWRVRELIVTRCLCLVKHDDALVAAKAKSILFEMCMLERDPRVAILLNTSETNALFKQMWNGKEEIGKKYACVLSLVERSLLAKQQEKAGIIRVEESDLTALKRIMGTLTQLQGVIGVDNGFLRRMNEVCGLFEETF